MKGAVLSIAFISITLLLPTSGLNITNPPTNITVCINTVAEINCGFTGANPNQVTPNWRIIMRNDNGIIVSNETIFGPPIVANLVRGLEWIPDLNSGADNATNSKLIFGPVNNTHNQSSFQCIFLSAQNEVITASSIGTITVVGPPSANITIDQVCISSITLSLSIYNHSACGGFSHNVNVMISRRAILPVFNDDSTYIFNGLSTNTRHNVTVTLIYNASDLRMFSKSVKTLVSKPPTPVDEDTIKVLTTKPNRVKITWKEPNIDTCLMSKIKFYDVNIRSDNGESVSMKTNSTVMTFLPSELVNNKSNISCILTIVVYNSEEMSSQPTSKIFIINNTTNDNDSNSGDDDNNNNSSTNSSSNSNNIAPIIAGVVIPIVVITIIILIIIVLLYFWYQNNHHHKSNVIDFKKKVEENSYGESYNDNIRIENDSVTAYAISGPSPQQNTEQLIDNSSLNESPPTLPPKINYAKLDMRDNVPKAVKVDKEVQYAETKPV